MQIFISYRRSDSSDVAGRLYDHLERRVGSHAIFKDVDSIPFGADFKKIIQNAINRSDLMMVLIGPKWIEESKINTSETKELSDWVRIEIESALQKNVKILPILLGNTQMPEPDSLPETIRSITDCNAARLRPDPDFKKDIQSISSSFGLPDARRDIIATQHKSLYINRIAEDEDSITFRYMALFSSLDATVPFGERRVRKELLLDIINSVLRNGDNKFENLVSLGAELSDVLLTRNTIELLEQDPEDYLLIYHDRSSSTIPWELINVKGEFPALRGGLSRRFVLEENARIPSRSLPTEDFPRVLIVADPGGNAVGAREEGEEIAKLLSKHNSEPQITILEGDIASRRKFLRELRDQPYELVHFAGGGYYNEDGIILSNNKSLTSSDLPRNFKKIPNLVFMSAAGIGHFKSNTTTNNSLITLSEAFLRHGVSNFVSTYCTENDVAGKKFTLQVYKRLFEGSTVGTAIREARRMLWQDGEKDALNYMHFGLPENTLLLRD